MRDLSTRYNPQKTEDKWCQYWEDNDIFHVKPNPDKKPYTIVIPPPNVTGILHMGHALNNTLQDIIIRYKRMKGYETLWMPGTDHAGIATQNVVEKHLAKEGKQRHDIGREEFIKRLWDWKKQYGDTIIHQLKKLGSSCDWTRTRFTMDEHYSEVVKLVFVRLYEKGLIYRGQYIINWCPRCQTALSDEESEHQETQGSLYHIKYPFKNKPNEYVIVATTRPETMLGDTAVAVNPNDDRYKHLIGQTLILPLMNREITIIADDYVKPEFGTGAVKVTPAHDPNDFNMGKRHNLDFVNILHPDARLNENAGPFNGLNRKEARGEVVNSLKKCNLLIKVEDYTHSVGHCYRCDTVIEPYLSKQWFVKMAPLAKPAIEVVKNDRIKFHPNRWTKVYLNWMENIRDWCISRQIWWGHRIPVWYCQDCPEGHNIIVSEDSPSQCPKCHGQKLKQDEDVLDTWFSSWLWPFATLYWPSEKKDVDYFYPTSSLFTAPEIIFFWVARMIMAGLECVGDIPFSDVYIHGTVRDTKGRKMSKSLGNAIDPLEIINEYGADALRFSLIVNSGQDLFISKEKFEIGRNFANKIWNASRLILINVPDELNPLNSLAQLKIEELDLPSQWIISKFYSTLNNVTNAIEEYRFSEAETLIYEFFWKNFCDWYLEMIKDKFSNENIQTVSLSILEHSLRIMHPFMPFVTEEIWQIIKPKQERSLSTYHWPQKQDHLINSTIENDTKTLLELISLTRNLRVEWNIKSSDLIDCYVETSTAKEITLFEENSDIIKKLARIKNFSVGHNIKRPPNAATGIIEQIKFYIPLNEVIDVSKEKNRIQEQIQQYYQAYQNISNRLANKDFTQKAPEEIVEKEKLRLNDLKGKINGLKSVVENLT